MTAVFSFLCYEKIICCVWLTWLFLTCSKFLLCSVSHNTMSSAEASPSFHFLAPVNLCIMELWVVSGDKYWVANLRRFVCIVSKYNSQALTFLHPASIFSSFVWNMQMNMSVCGDELLHPASVSCGRCEQRLSTSFRIKPWDVRDVIHFLRTDNGWGLNISVMAAWQWWAKLILSFLLMHPI